MLQILKLFMSTSKKLFWLNCFYLNMDLKKVRDFRKEQKDIY